MRVFDKIILVLGTVMAVAIAGWLFIEFSAKPTNCGGNSYALTVCKYSVTEFRLASDNLGNNFNVNQLPSEERFFLIKMANSGWINGAKIFIRTNIALYSQKKQVLVVCDKPYGNIPQPTIRNFYHQNPAHAVGYSDGTAGLIKPDEFKKLNLAEFIDVAILPTNSVSTNNKPVP